MHIEDNIVALQILDCWMAGTSLEQICEPDFAEKRDYNNVGHMIHANTLGEFEERYAGGLYLADA